MTYVVERLAPELNFGRVVKGLCLADLSIPSTCEDLRALWSEAGLIKFCIDDISEQFHLELSRVFGPLEIHKTREYLSENTPEIVTLTTSGDTLVEVDGEVGEFFSWHKDLVYTQQINRGGILRSLRPSDRGGLTGFIDQIDAYERLPEDLKQRIEGLSVVYQIMMLDEGIYARQHDVKLLKRSAALESIIERRTRDFPPVSHPLVFVHPDNGRKVLNFSPFFAMRIEGLDREQSDQLLGLLAEHIFASPAYHHSWTTGEMLLWDNWRMLHMVGMVPKGETRTMQRTTIAGDYGLGRLAEST